jgi:very-short-patch-repair endonuclease
VPRSAQVPRQLRSAPFRGRDAVAAGLLTRRQLDGPVWSRLFPDVYLHRDACLDHLTWCSAAWFVLPAGGAISGASAAYVYGADVLARNAPVEVSIPRDRNAVTHPKLLVRRARLDPGDTRSVGRLLVTTPTRTAFDLARRGRTEAVVGLDALLRKRVTSKDRIHAYLSARCGWPGARRVREALELARPAESPMETRLRLLLIDAGLPCPTVQYEVVVDGGRYRLDLAYPEVKLAIEYDGDHHRERVTFHRDVARLNALRAAGWTVLRFTADDVLRHPDRVVAQVRAVLG